MYLKINKTISQVILKITVIKFDEKTENNIFSMKQLKFNKMLIIL